MPIAGMPTVVTLNRFDEMGNVPVIDSKTGLKVGQPFVMIGGGKTRLKTASWCHYGVIDDEICNKCGRIHDGTFPDLTGW